MKQLERKQMLKTKYILDYIIIVLLLVFTVEALEYIGFIGAIENIEMLIIAGTTYLAGLFHDKPGGSSGL